MKKFILFFFLGLVLIPAKSFSQFDSVGVCNCYLPLDTLTYQPVQFTLGPDSVSPPDYYNNMNTSQAIKLPFKFCFYGTDYDTIYIGNKGNISFVKPIYRFTTGNFPAGNDTMMIAPFWADICNIPYGPFPLGAGVVWYKLNPTNLVIQWYEAGYHHFDDDLYNNFQLIISNGADPIIPGGNNVEFCYVTSNGMQWASSDSSGGTNGFAGIPATVGINKGDKTSYAVISRFSLPGLTYYGPTSAINGLSWLNGKSFILNTCVTEKNIPPVILNPNVCDTLIVCRWDSILYSVYFLCAEQGQKTTLSASCPTLSGIVTDTVSSSNSIYVIHVKDGIGDATLGYHTINVTATDNSTPPQTITYPIVVNVNICNGINEVIDNSGFSLYPNANNGRFTIQLNDTQLPEKCKVIIYDMLGKEIYSAQLNDYKTDIDLSDKAKGMYFLKIYREDIMLGVKKIIIQ